MYIPDGLGGALGEVCIDRCCNGLGPPWKPDAIGRQTGMLMLALRPKKIGSWGSAPAEVIQLMSQFLHHWDQP